MLQTILFLLLIGIFLFGMLLIRNGLFNLSADSLKRWLLTLTDAPWKGLLLGTVVTSILQSSSAVMVITVGLVAARLLTFSQSIGIMLGANIGTTMTAEIITLDINLLIIPMAIIGVLLTLFRKKNLQNTGFVFIGLASVFGAMWGFEELARPLREMAFINEMVLALSSNYLYAILAGIIITCLIQSSSATTGITMTFLAAGTFNLETGIAIVLGANIGTCFDVWLASFGGGREAKLSAYAHIWLNVLGVAAFIPFIGVLATIGENLATQLDVQLAHVSVIFNVAVSLIVLPFTAKFARLIEKIHGRKLA